MTFRRNITSVKINKYVGGIVFSSWNGRWMPPIHQAHVATADQSPTWKCCSWPRRVLDQPCGFIASPIIIESYINKLANLPIWSSWQRVQYHAFVNNTQQLAHETAAIRRKWWRSYARGVARANTNGILAWCIMRQTSIGIKVGIHFDDTIGDAPINIDALIGSSRRVIINAWNDIAHFFK